MEAFGWVRVLVKYFGPYGDAYETSAMFRVQFIGHRIDEWGGKEFNYCT